MAQTSVDRSGDQFTSLKDKAADQLSSAAARAEDMTHRAMERGREASQGMQEVAGNFKAAVDRSISNQPMATLAVAAMLGFVLGALWKS
jgi:ElaB/YqjD/DUF883 family membrane-anchored ribosome-binding protein